MLPKILVYHNRLGGSREDGSRNPNRDRFCQEHRLLDVTEDDVQTRPVEAPIAEAQFSTLPFPASGDPGPLSEAADRILEQWSSNDRASLLLLGLRFGTESSNASPSPPRESQSDGSSSHPYGLQLLRRIRSSTSPEEVPVVVMVSEGTARFLSEESLRRIQNEIENHGAEVVRQEALDLVAHLDQEEVWTEDPPGSDTGSGSNSQSKEAMTDATPILHTRTLPRLLVIDDELGRRSREGWKSRRSFCKKFGVRDVTGDSPPGRLPEINVDEPIAEAVFCNGQREINGALENDLEGTLETVRSGWPKGTSEQPRWALLLLDLHFKTGKLDSRGEPEGRARDRDPQNYFGLKVLEEIWESPEFTHQWQPQSRTAPERIRPPVVLFSAMDREDIESRFARPGVFSFIERPELNGSDREDSYRRHLVHLLRQHGLIDDERIIGRSLPLLHALRKARRRATGGQDNVLLLGESGTGKELVGPYMHRHSGRDGDYRPFLAGNVREENIPQQLFGAEPIFAGMDEVKVGDAELADEGTLFIDEFGDVREATQERLKRLLDLKTRSFQRVGGTETITVDLLVVGATNEMNITEKAQDDVIWRRMQASNPIELPALRQRKEDIRLLTEFFVRKYEDFYEVERRDISQETFELLEAHDWRKGNVGSLENTIRHVINVYGGLRELTPSLLQLPDDSGTTSPPSPQTGSPTVPSADSQAQRRESDRPPSSIDELIEELDAFEPDKLRIGELRGRLLPLHRAYYQLIARLLNRALEVKRTEKGELRYTSSMLLLGGDELPRESATTLRRYIQRLLKTDRKLDRDLDFLSEVISELPALRELLESGPAELQEILHERLEDTI